MSISKDQVLGIVRHVLTAVGVYLVAKGLASEGLVEEGVGGALTLASVLWSILSKKS